MRFLIACVVAVSVAVITPVFAEKARGPYDRVASGKPPASEGVKIYTNADLARLFGIVDEDDREEPAPAIATPAPTTGQKPEAAPDPLAWLQQSEAAKREHALALAEAETALAQARARVADLERQLLASRNPFSARPVLSDEEKKKRSESTETAAERNQRTQRLVEEAREAVRVAEAEVAQLRAKRP